jgi:hypothetical protein
MHLQVLLAVIASALSIGIIARMVILQIKSSHNRPYGITKKTRYLFRRVDGRLRFIRYTRYIVNDTITVTNKETNASVQLPPHYDRQAVSRFLEITA